MLDNGNQNDIIIKDKVFAKKTSFFKSFFGKKLQFKVYAKKKEGVSYENG